MPPPSSFFIEQFVDEALGNSAYLVGSRETRQAALIDPLRDVDRYLAAAEGQGVNITHVLDTHLHADFVSGARELAAQVGARIGASAEAKVGFEHQPLVEGDLISLGHLTLSVLRTPGHTPEHISFLLNGDNAPTPTALFSGGALIVGGAARTDLLGHDLSLPLARHLYHTLHDKIMVLPDAVNVYPTHGAGSFCAAPTSSDRVTTIGRERQHNVLAQARSEEEFVQLSLSGLPSYPVYYREMRGVNQRGPQVFGGLPLLKPLSADEVQGYAERGTLVLDVRSKDAFAEAHLPGAYGIQLDAPLSTWAGWLIPFGVPLVLVAENAGERADAIRQLIRIGYDNLTGYLADGLAAWGKAGLKTESLPTISIRELHEQLQSGDSLMVLDVRQDSEWETGHIPGAMHIEAGRLPWDDLPLPTDKPVVAYCARGARSTAGVSVLVRRGYRNVLQVREGFDGWAEAGFEIATG